MEYCNEVDLNLSVGDAKFRKEVVSNVTIRLVLQVFMFDAQSEVVELKCGKGCKKKSEILLIQMQLQFFVQLTNAMGISSLRSKELMELELIKRTRRKER